MSPPEDRKNRTDLFLTPQMGSSATAVIFQFSPVPNVLRSKSLSRLADISKHQLDTAIERRTKIDKKKYR